MKEISQEMAEKNITTEFIDVWDYIKDEITKEIDEHGLIEAVRLVDSKIIFLVICYSSNLNLKFLLEGSGILSEIKMNRDLCIQSKGKILTMSKVQKEFLQTMAKPENITKRLVQIEGQVGSGKTLLGIELIKMKVAHYLRFHGLTADQGKEKIRVIIVIENGWGNVLKTHLEKVTLFVLLIQLEQINLYIILQFMLVIINFFMLQARARKFHWLILTIHTIGVKDLFLE